MVKVKYEDYGFVPFCRIPPLVNGRGRVVFWKLNPGCGEELRVLCEGVRVEMNERMFLK